MRPSVRCVPVTIIFAAALVACGPASSSSSNDTGDETPAAIEIAGTWDDAYAGPTVISNDAWGPSKVASYDDASRSAVVQSPADDPYTPNQFSKFVWTKPDEDGFWYCIVDYGETTAEAAKATTKTADATHPADSGCGKFSWTRMYPHLDLDGTWDDGFGDTVTISATTWDKSKIVSFDDAARYAIVQSPADDPYTPNQFAKYVWTKSDATGFYFCTVDYGEQTADAAKNTTKTADATHPDQGGCGGFSWTHMTPHAS